MPGTSGMPFDTQDEPFLDVERSDFQLLKRVRSQGQAMHMLQLPFSSLTALLGCCAPHRRC